MDNIQVVRRLLQAWEEHDPDTTRQLLADDMELTGPAPQPLGKDAFVTFQQVHTDAFNDWKFNPIEFQTNGDDVTVQFRISATHTGPFDVARLGVPLAPVPATGKSRSWPQESMIVTVREGTIHKIHVNTGPGGGVIGTLEWLGAPLPAIAQA